MLWFLLNFLQNIRGYVITSSICFAELHVTALFYVMYLLILRLLCIVYWSRVEWKLPVPVFKCLIVRLEANMFVKCMDSTH